MCISDVEVVPSGEGEYYYFPTNVGSLLLQLLLSAKSIRNKPLVSAQDIDSPVCFKFFSSSIGLAQHVLLSIPPITILGQATTSVPIISTHFSISNISKVMSLYTTFNQHLHTTLPTTSTLSIPTGGELKLFLQERGTGVVVPQPV